MNKEDLLKLKKKISELSSEEKKIRDLYLRSLSNGEIQGPMTGIPSIDKPWLKHYSENQIISEIPKVRMYEDLKQNMQGYLSNIAIEYFGKKITYEELLNNIEIVANAFACDGVKAGDKVSVCLPYIPETVYIIYALNKIGAVVNMIDPRINYELLAEYISNANSRYVIIIDKIEEKMKKISEKIDIDRIVSISPLNSHGNKIISYYSKIKKSSYVKWDKFLKKSMSDVNMAPYSENELAVIEYTSGTSGNPKGVELSNEAFVSLSYFQKQSLINKVGDKFLLIMPPFIAYGLVIGMHGMLSEGQHLIMIPNFSLDKAPKMFGELVNKHHPECIMGVPNFLTILMNYKKDLSFLKTIIIGGDHLDSEIEKKARKFLLSRGSNARIDKGWGMTEIASCGSFTKTDIENKIGSVGIPLSKNNVRILPINVIDDVYDIDEVELGYDESGIMFVNSPSMMQGYYKKTDETKKIVYTDRNGEKWINTGDIFKVSSDGDLYFSRRIKRVIVRPDGHNIPTSKIENIASANELVDSAVVVGIPSRKYAHGEYAALCIKLKDNDKEFYEISEVEKILSQIEDNIIKELQPRDRINYICVVDKLLFTMNGKVDHTNITKYIVEKLDNMNYFDDENNEVLHIYGNDFRLSEKHKSKKLTMFNK